jgi:hypothetical protein
VALNHEIQSRRICSPTPPPRGRLAAATTFVDRGRSLQSPDLARVLAPPCQPVQRRRVEATSQFQHCRRGKLQVVCNLESDPVLDGNS